MPRLLIVSPHFPPVNAPDMQRVRMSLPHFVRAGWEVVVLTVDDREPQAPLEPELLATIPAAVRVVRAPAWSRRWTRWLGLNNLGLRTLPFLWLAGRRLLSEKPFDLVYFSTTQFIVLPLGRLWRRKFGTPYVIDLQDPWLSDFYDRPGSPPPPGGWKYRLAHASARLLEGWTLSRAAHVISVSEAYLETLRRRYPWFETGTGSVLTFGVPDLDLALAREKFATAPRLLPATDRLKIAYAGRLGPDMQPALEVLFGALAQLRDAPPGFELFFHGTSYAAKGQGVPTAAPLARRRGLGDLVHEQPDRIGYIDSLRLLLEGDLALLLGSADPDYSPSKVYPTLITGRPVVAVAPAGSVLAEKLRELGGAILVTFNSHVESDPDAIGLLAAALRSFASTPATFPGLPLKHDVLAQRYSSGAVAAAQLAIFDGVRHRPRSPATAANPKVP